MIVHTDIEQNSVDWMILRAGKITASEADALVSPTGKVRDSEGVTTYLHQKLAERWTGGPLASLQGVFDMEQGKILEERAKPAFTIHTGLEVKTVAFIEADDGRSGCSPDGMLDGSGVEIKCPRLDTHIGYLLSGKLPKQYAAQVQFSMFVTGFATWHFFSYRSSFPPLHVVVERNAMFQTALKVALADFIGHLDAAFLRLCGINGGPPQRFVASTPVKPSNQPLDADDVPH